MRKKFVFPFVTKGKYKFVHSTLTALFLFLKVALERAIIKRYTDYYSMFDTSGISHTQKTKQITVWDVTGPNTSPNLHSWSQNNCGDSAAFKFPRKWLDKNVFSGKVYTV